MLFLEHVATGGQNYDARLAKALGLDIAIDNDLAGRGEEQAAPKGAPTGRSGGSGKDSHLVNQQTVATSTLAAKPHIARPPQHQAPARGS